MSTQSYHNTIQNEAYFAAKSQVDRLKKFYAHLFFYTIGLTIYILKTYFQVHFNFLLLNKISFLFIAIWTGIISIRAIKLFLGNYFLGHQWEKNKIQEIMNREANNQNYK